MAKLDGLLKLRGSVGGLTFVRGEHGETYVKEKSGPRPCRLKDGEDFANSRRAAAEFKTSGKATRTFRYAMDRLLAGVEGRSLTGRINAWLLRAIQSDAVNEWGYRRVEAGDLTVLEGFEFNESLPLEELLPLNLRDRVPAGRDEARISVPGFRLRRADKNVPKLATHFRMVSAMIFVDFDKHTYSRAVRVGPMTAIGRKSGADFDFDHGIVPKPGELSFWLLGVEFVRQEGDKPVVVRGGAVRCMRVWGA
ncbi:hypothetical protein [Paraflavitalea pollutisoli]|uniref:hypothetical protein n=1 Tax=Paraflavitalea pollutisoli TaxID=3034143 RepID=UPI0023EE1544|nr:hypothetical protein [Paraflavitalea sp. H1-2-19X]